MSLPLSDSLSLFTDSPDDELRYFFNLSRGLIQQRLAAVEPRMSYTREVAQLRLLEEMIIEQLPSLQPEEGAK